MASIYATGSNGHHKFTLTVSQISTSQEENTSAVRFQFTISPVVKSYDWRYWGSSIRYCVDVNGTAFTGTIPDYDGYSAVILKSDSLSVLHNEDGTKKLSFGFTVTDSANMSYTCGNASADGTMDLTRIHRNPPTLAVGVEDSNPATVALTGDPGKLVRYFSNATFTFEAEAHDGATVESRTVTCGGKTLSGESGVFEKVESGSFVFTATDSYGNSASEQLELPKIPYVPLTCDLAPTRPDAEGNMAVSVSGNCFQGSFGATDNALAVFIRYREVGDSFGDWVALTVNQSGNRYTASGELTGLDYQRACVFQAKAEDLLDTAETPEYTAKAIPVFDWGENDFNVNGTFKVNGTPVADFIVEQGVSGNWIYRKWNSGVAECWGHHTVNSGEWTDVATSAEGVITNIRYSKDTASVNYPSGFFISDPVANITVLGAGGAVVAPFAANSTAVAVGTHFTRIAGGSDFKDIVLGIHAIGKWKEVEHNE